MEILEGDNRVLLRDLRTASVDAIVTDPPYGLKFMGKDWDKALPDPVVWSECLRVLKPGGHMIAFGAPRLYHRLACQIEDAGFEIRDCLMWLFGSGFPKSLDVSKAFDKKAGAKREAVGVKSYPREGTTPVTRLGKPDKYGEYKGGGQGSNLETAPATELAKQWEGWGTALKPAYEPIVLARKPLSGTVIETVEEYGTGAINIDGCRVPTEGRPRRKSERRPDRDGSIYKTDLLAGSKAIGETTIGRWPANLILDEETGAMLDEQTGELKSGMLRQESKTAKNNIYGQHTYTDPKTFPANRGGASRFFYCAKASRSEREEGLNTPKGERRNKHPTVKPLALMEYLVRLITPPGGLVLDPFTGSGSTGVAATKQGYEFVGMELEADYCEIASKRIAAVK